MAARGRTHFWLLAGGLAVLFVYACSSGDQAEQEWVELTGEVGGGGPGGAPATSTTQSASSATGGGMGGGGGSGGAGGGGGGGAPCNDTGPDEPNETEATAVYLGMIDDYDTSGSSLSGVLTDAVDVDWYRYYGADEGGIVDPTRNLLPSGIGRLCKFAQCTDGSAAVVTCNDGSSPAVSPMGRPGCCRNQGFWMDVECDTGDDGAQIFIRVDQPASICAQYTLSYNY